MDQSPVTIFKSFEYSMCLMEKQIRMLAELADASPLAHQSEQAEGLPPETEFVIVDRRRMHELLEHLKTQLACVRYGLKDYFGAPGNVVLEEDKGGFGGDDV